MDRLTFNGDSMLKQKVLEALRSYLARGVRWDWGWSKLRLEPAEIDSLNIPLYWMRLALGCETVLEAEPDFCLIFLNDFPVGADPASLVRILRGWIVRMVCHLSELVELQLSRAPDFDLDFAWLSKHTDAPGVIWHGLQLYFEKTESELKTAIKTLASAGEEPSGVFTTRFTIAHLAAQASAEILSVATLAKRIEHCQYLVDKLLTAVHQVVRKDLGYGTKDTIFNGLLIALRDNSIRAEVSGSTPDYIA